MRSLAFIVAMAAMGGCTESSLSSTDAPPQVSIIAPVEAQVFAADELIELVAVVGDDRPTSALDVSISWEDGLLGNPGADEQGNVFMGIAAAEMGDGPHVLTVQAIDERGQAGKAAVNITVGEGGDVSAPGAPNVVITAPADGATFMRDEAVAVVGTAVDAEQSADSLSASLVDSVGGLIWEGNPSTTGSIDETWTDFAVGDHTLTLTAIDQDSNIGSATVSFSVLNDGRPFATITNPLAGSAFALGETITFEGVVSDFEDDAEELLYYWESDIDLVLDSGSPDSGGYTAFGGTLSAGTHRITLRVVDTEGKEASDSLLIEVDDDLDGDGYTIAEGDCDDHEAAVNPGETDVCDLLDNDCNGIVNDPAMDTYEPNDTHDVPHDFGEVDNDLGPFFGDTLEVFGLTVHNDADEDWYAWDADDSDLDSADLIVSIDTPLVGTYVMELYHVVGGAYWDFSQFDLEGSVAGTGLMTINYDGGPGWPIGDDDDDHWALRVYTTSWDVGACEELYAIQVIRN